MTIEIIPEGLWYHGSPMLLSELRAGSTITQWRALAEAFSHKPHRLCYDDRGRIEHDGQEKGYIYPHPRSTMDANAEFLTKRPLRVKLVAEL